VQEQEGMPLRIDHEQIEVCTGHAVKIAQAQHCQDNHQESHDDYIQDGKGEYQEAVPGQDQRGGLPMLNDLLSCASACQGSGSSSTCAAMSIAIPLCSTAQRGRTAPA
jgi:hypothetical protein